MQRRGHHRAREVVAEGSVRVEREGAADDVDGAVVLGAQPGVAAPAHRPLDVHVCRELRWRPPRSLFGDPCRQGRGYRGEKAFTTTNLQCSGHQKST